MVFLGRGGRRRTSIGTFEVHAMAPRLVGGYEIKSGRRIATAEKAVFDMLYLGRTSSPSFRHMPEIELPTSFSEARLREWLPRVENPLKRGAIEGDVASFLHRAR